jgi:hypothetical protein
VEAPQGVQLTGTNRPRTCHKTHASTVQLPEHGQKKPATQLHTSYGGHSGGETPGPIPNPEAKPSSADGTAPARVWESRTPPNTHPTKGAPTTPPGAPLVLCFMRGSRSLWHPDRTPIPDLVARVQAAVVRLILTHIVRRRVPRGVRSTPRVSAMTLVARSSRSVLRDGRNRMFPVRNSPPICMALSSTAISVRNC